MKIINSIQNDSISMSQQANPQSSLVNKIKEIISNLLNFIKNNTFCMDQSKIAISKQVNQPTNLSHEILRVLEEGKSSREDKNDHNYVTFLFKEPIYDIPTNNKRVLDESIYEEMNAPIYDIPTNNKRVLDEPIYDIPSNNKRVLDESIYDIPTNNKRVLDESIYEEMNAPIYDIPTNNKRVLDESIYDIPTNNKPVLEEPIYEEIDESHFRPQDTKIINDIPPPLPPRNW